MGSNWTESFFTGIFGLKVSDEEWAAQDEARRPKPKPVKLPIRYDNARPVPQHVPDGLLVSMALLIGAPKAP